LTQKAIWVGHNWVKHNVLLRRCIGYAMSIRSFVDALFLHNVLLKKTHSSPSVRNSYVWSWGAL